MAKTFRDFIMECEMYPYSRENYELIKECSELEIMEKFLENQKYYKEHADIISASSLTITEDYFHESVDESTMDSFFEKYSAKKSSIGTKIKNGLNKIIKTFANFFARIGNKFDETTSTGQSVLKKLNSMKLTDQQIVDIKKIVDDVKAKDSSAFPVAPNQPYLKNIKLQYTSADGTFSDLKNDLAAALSDKIVVANVLTTESGQNVDIQNIGAVPVDAIKDVVEAVIKGNGHQIIGASKALASTWLDVKKNGMKIEVNTKRIDKNAQDLNEICSRIEQMGKAEANNAGVLAGTIAGTAKAVGQAVGKDVNIEPDDTAAAAVRETNAAYTSIVAAIGQSTRIYTRLNAYRQGVITGLHNYLKSVKDNSNG